MGLTNKGKKEPSLAFGGQAVMEGVMIRSKKHMVVCVRQPNDEIMTKTEEINSLADRFRVLRLPFVRGILALFETLFVGIKGIYYSANNIWIIGRRQNKTGTEVTGYDFVIKVEKSRFVKEQSKIPISVSWEGGIDQYSGLLEIALASGHVVKPSNGWYAKASDPEKKYRASQLDGDFWHDLLREPSFVEFVEQSYCVGSAVNEELDFEVVE